MSDCFKLILFLISFMLIYAFVLVTILEISDLKERVTIIEAKQEDK